MYKLIFILAMACTCSAKSQDAVKPPVLLGKCSLTTLRSSPYDEWFSPGFKGYHPNESVAEQLKNISFKDITIDVFFGSWCGDSKREVPRFLKLMQDISFPSPQILLIGVGGSDSLYKQSPDHEEQGKGIFRVPTFIILKNGKEMARINEYPVNSLEKDLLQILQAEPYTPNYQTFDHVKHWLADGTLLDENIASAGLAGQLSGKQKNEFELNSLGYLLLDQGLKKEALKIFLTNFSLYPESSNVLSSLGEGFLENGDHKKAVTYLERSLALNKDPQTIPGILKVLYKSWEAGVKH